MSTQTCLPPNCRPWVYKRDHANSENPLCRTWQTTSALIATSSSTSEVICLCMSEFTQEKSLTSASTALNASQQLEIATTTNADTLNRSRIAVKPVASDITGNTSLSSMPNLSTARHNSHPSCRKSNVSNLLPLASQCGRAVLPKVISSHTVLKKSQHGLQRLCIKKMLKLVSRHLHCWHKKCRQFLCTILATQIFSISSTH